MDGWIHSFIQSTLTVHVHSDPPSQPQTSLDFEQNDAPLPMSTPNKTAMEWWCDAFALFVCQWQDFIQVESIFHKHKHKDKDKHTASKDDMDDDESR